MHSIKNAGVNSTFAKLYQHPFSHDHFFLKFFRHPVGVALGDTEGDNHICK